MKNRHLFPTLSLVGTCALLFAVAVFSTGCVEPPKEEGAESAASDGSAATSPYRDRLIIGQPSDVQTLDPGQATDFESAQVLYLTCETLLAFDEETLDIVPLLAESYEVSDDGLVWSFKLREGVKFHDGTPLNSEAIKYNLTRFLATSEEEHPAYVPHMPYRETLFQGVMKDVTVKDDLNFDIILEKPFVAFAANLATFAAGIASPAAFEKYGEDIVRNPVGTGPYKLVKWVTQSEVHLTVNEDYWGDQPETKNLYFKVLADPNQIFNAILLGEVDIVKGVGTKYLKEIEKKDEINIVSAPQLVIGYIAINNEKEKFKDKRVRQAMNYAVNKKFIVEKLFDNTSVVCVGALPPGMLGALDEPVYPYNPDKARALLAEAGLKENELELTITTYSRPRPYNPAAEKLALNIEQDLRAVGIDTSVELVDWGKFLKDRSTGAYELGNVGWGSDNGDPDNTIYNLFGTPSNNIRWNHPEATKLMLEAQVEADVDKRRKLYEEANRIIIEEAPIIFLNHGKQILAARDRVEGLTLHPSAIQRFEKVKVKK